MTASVAAGSFTAVKITISAHKWIFCDLTQINILLEPLGLASLWHGYFWGCELTSLKNSAQQYFNPSQCQYFNIFAAPTTISTLTTKYGFFFFRWEKLYNTVELHRAHWFTQPCCSPFSPSYRHTQTHRHTCGVHLDSNDVTEISSDHKEKHWRHILVPGMNKRNESGSFVILG